MKCPRCQNECPDDTVFCPSCGAWINNRPAEPRRKNGVVSSVFKALFYIFLMLFMQGIVEYFFLVRVLSGDLLTAMSDLQSAMMDAMDLLFENISMVLLVANLLTILVVFLLFSLRRKNPVEEIGLRWVNWRLLPLCAVYGMAMNVFLSITISYLPLPAGWLEGLDSQYSVLMGQTNPIIEILNTALLTGFVEEMIFRGLAQSRLKRGMSRTAAIIISALLFGLCHGVAIAICYATVLGLVFGLLTERHDSILPSVVCHVFFNLTNFILVADSDWMLILLYAGAIAVLVTGSIVLFRKSKKTDETEQS